MTLILCIETSSDICSVALAADSAILGSVEASEPNAHSSGLSDFIRQVLDKTGVRMSDLNAVAVSKGPGSFTGLRIGVAFAKGLAFGLDIPLVSADTLKSLAGQAVNEAEPELLYCPVINARNGEQYFALYDMDLNELIEPSVIKMEIDFFSRMTANRKVLFIGDIPGFASQVPGLHFMNNIRPAASSLAKIAFEKFNRGDFENIEEFEPFYLKDFKAKKFSEKIRRILNGKSQTNE